MSGTKAGLSYPSWPDMNGEVVPEIVFNSQEWNVENFVEYDRNGFLPAFIQTCHRTTAYLLIIIGLWYFFRGRKLDYGPGFNRALNLWITMLVICLAILPSGFTSRFAKVCTKNEQIRASH